MSKISPQTEDLIQELVGTMTDKALAEMAGVSVGTIIDRRKKAGKPAFGRQPREQEIPDHLIGTMSDRQLAIQLDLPMSVIQARRRKLNVASWMSTKTRPVEAVHDKIGKMSDYALSEESKIPIATIRTERIRLGRPPYRKQWQKGPRK